MGKVVTLAPAAKDRRSGARRPRRSKTALVLGGGGFTGGVYEIGALRALDLLTVNRTVNDFDVYVGTSAGAFVAALTANGVTPQEMMRVVNRQRSAAFPDVDLGNLLRPNVAGFARSALALPLRAAQLLRGIAAHPGQVSAMDLVLGLAGAMPAGAYSGAGIERYLRAVLDGDERSDDFRRVAAQLYIPATDIDTCERIVFGADGWDDVPISTAVRASSAVPMLYAPVRVGGRELVDGGVVSTTNLDIAVDAGAQLVVVVNPLVPYVDDVATKAGARGRRISDMGFPQVGYQVFKLVAYQRLHEMARQWEQRYPGVDIILIEPEPDDELMFQTPIMSYASRVDVARHGFESVTSQLAASYPRQRATYRRHGIEISAARVRAVVERAEAQRGRTRAWRRVLEQTTAALLRHPDEQPEAPDSPPRPRATRGRDDEGG